jgi:hypothetical protein
LVEEVRSKANQKGRASSLKDSSVSRRFCRDCPDAEVHSTGSQLWISCRFQQGWRDINAECNLLKTPKRKKERQKTIIMLTVTATPALITYYYFAFGLTPKMAIYLLFSIFFIYHVFDAFIVPIVKRLFGKKKGEKTQ